MNATKKDVAIYDVLTVMNFLDKLMKLLRRYLLIWIGHKFFNCLHNGWLAWLSRDFSSQKLATFNNIYFLLVRNISLERKRILFFTLSCLAKHLKGGEWKQAVDTPHKAPVLFFKTLPVFIMDIIPAVFFFLPFIIFYMADILRYPEWIQSSKLNWSYYSCCNTMCLKCNELLYPLGQLGFLKSSLTLNNGLAQCLFVCFFL